MRRYLVISSATRFVPTMINTLAKIVCGRTGDFDLALEDPDRFLNGVSLNQMTCFDGLEE